MKLVFMRGRGYLIIDHFNYYEWLCADIYYNY